MACAMSGIHDCYREYSEMLEKIAFSNTDLLYIIGNVVGRCAQRREQWLLLNTNSGTVQLREFELCYVEIFDHHIRYHTLQANYDAYGTLKSVEQRLPAHSFFRCNNQCIINLRYVSKLEGGTVVVDGREFPISRMRKKAFLAQLHRYSSFDREDRQ